MKTFPIYTKRDGQGWHESGYVMATDYAAAQKEFAQTIWREFLEGCYGDNYIHENDESIKQLKDEGIDTSWYSGEGIYYENELYFSYTDVNSGIESFTEDVYTWTIDADRI